MSQPRRGSAETPGGTSLTGLLVLMCGCGLLLSRRSLVSLSAPEVRTTVSVLIWIASGVMLLVGCRETAWPRRRRRVRRRRQLRRAPAIGLYYLGVMAVLLVGSLIGGENLLMLVTALMIGPWLLNAWVNVPLMRRIGVRRMIPPRAMAGEVVSVGLEVSNPIRWLPGWLLLVTDRVACDDGEQAEASVLFAQVPAQQQRTGYYRLRPARRGRYRLGPIEISTRFPLGLIERAVLISQPDELRVYPRIGRVVPEAVAELVNASQTAARELPRRGPFDDEFHSLREFRPGDNPRALHWRTSARRGELMVREFRQARDQHLDLVLDLWQPRRADDAAREAVERAASVAATLAIEHLRSAREARLKLTVCGRGVSRLDSRGGPAGILELLDLLATVQAGASTGVEALCDELLAPGTRGLVVTTRLHESDRREPLAAVTAAAGRTLIGVEPRELKSWFRLE